MPICTRNGCMHKGAEQSEDQFLKSGPKWCRDCRVKYQKEWRAGQHQRKAVPERVWKSFIASDNRIQSQIRHGVPIYKDLSVEQFNFVCGFYDYQCMYCGGSFESLDHIEPIRLGGSHTIDNVGPCCQSCNSKKNAKPLIDFVLEQDLDEERVAKILWARENLADIWFS